MTFIKQDFPNKYDLKEKVMLKGYQTIKTDIKRMGSEAYLISFFGGNHANEYTIAELQNDKVKGTVQLFVNGLLELSWNMKEKQYFGYVSVYSSGCFKYALPWSSLEDGADMRLVYNVDKSSVMQVVDSTHNEVIYYGQYNIDTFACEGYGLEIDPVTGKPKRVGIFKNNTIYRVLLEITSDHSMIEYTTAEHSNMDVISRHPVYIGGFKQDANGYFYRLGSGYAYSSITGLMINPVETKDDSSNPKCFSDYSYYNQYEYCTTSLLMMIHCNPVKEYKTENWSSRNIPVDTTHLTCLYNNELDICRLPLLTSLTIQGCSNNNLIFHSLLRLTVLNININNNNTGFGVLGGFGNYNNDTNSHRGYVSINNCPSLKTLSIYPGQEASFYLKNCHALKKLVIPAFQFENGDELIIDSKNSKLEEIEINNNCFTRFKVFRLLNLPLLKSLKIHMISCCGNSNQRQNENSPIFYKNCCEFNNLISLSSITMENSNNNDLYGNRASGNTCPFCYVGTVFIEKTPVVKTCNLTQKSFSDVFVLRYNDAGILPEYIKEHTRFDNITHNYSVCCDRTLLNIIGAVPTGPLGHIQD